MGAESSVIFIANVLLMNGGSTFILRMARQYSHRGERCAVLLIRDLCDADLLTEVEKYATVIKLSEFQIGAGRFSLGLLGAFAPINWSRLRTKLRPYGMHVHAMSIFGLVLALRFARLDAAIRPTVGIYHQNEFIFRPSRFFFPTFVRAIFKALPARNIVFFSESSRDNYAAFFRQDYRNSSLLPIGIEIEAAPTPRVGNGCRIVSIGNLVDFKTYNRHMITVVAELRKTLPSITYDIFGSGPMEDELRQHAAHLKVDDRVCLPGTLDYSRFHEIISDYDLFVGSGTALIEAAAAGRPALIGIESIKDPETFGYLSDINGFSYNEMRPGVRLFSMAPLVEKLLIDPKHWTDVAKACERKAHEFRIERTISGFDALFGAAQRPAVRLTAIQLIRMGASAVMMRLFEKVGLNEPFGDRRNQSY